MLKKITVNHFRCFEGKTFEMGKRITVISGHNATGKSTLLGLIGHSCELKKHKGEPILHKYFRTEFSEIFKASPEKDKYRGYWATLYFEPSLNSSYMKYRSTWQEEKGKNEKRFRIISSQFNYNNDKLKNERKYEIPSLYLGLSRLYPLGETGGKITKKKLITFKDAEERNWYINNYRSILSLNEDIDSFVNLDIDSTKKRFLCANTDKYDYLCNSAGQDNLSQILIAILSFKRLKSSLNPWPGGILLIDEVDATLHPSAQNRLFELLFVMSEQLDMQIVFTTHSLSLLSYIYKCKDANNLYRENTNIIYLTTANLELEVFVNPHWDVINNDMQITSLFDNDEKISVYTEDAEAIWFLKKALKDFPSYNRIDFIEIDNSYSKLLEYRKKDAKHFSKVIIVLDGDVKDSLIDPEFKNVLKLPGNTSIEELLYKFLLELPPNSRILDPEIGFTKRNIKDFGPENRSIYTDDKPRERYKKWFNDNKEKFETLNVFEEWASQNKDELRSFLHRFKRCYNIVCTVNGLPRIN